ncbi:conjugal transfer pilus assembly protein TrbC [Brevundimonas nasdae]|uniref:Type-F conjugative transfer system pilin assembly protein TrbC n=1 Tax=Brevundimonas nasdae TaxID=172043 RepID=A0ABX8TMB1_9CAUL|nr:type-F conjugative transfer system pilin assembly protein TrbC [Brevundimonas nasdae]MBK6026809.1 type-F conjugative transfer system pilin assembly protein TrbC [Brevundimonas nasdae]MDQ0453384.1 conjugal transfer pilus assembly protein TrbC [Brevundimonas nasdae]QYC12380.1 type-F conjugative transfer system pilin assembly protein TrbC [Brevundimonas nasdae]
MSIPTFDGTVSAWIIVGGIFYVAINLLWLGWRANWPIMQMASGAMALGAVLWTCTPVLAQDATGAAVRALIDEAEARGRSAEASLGEWLSQATRISEAHREEARTLSAVNEARLAEGMRMVALDDSAFGDAAKMMIANEDEGGALYIAVSLTMPREALRQLSADAQKAGARLVIRGLVDGSFERTLVVARQVFGQDDLSGLAIEPQVFRAYGVDRVPTFIAATSPVQPCQDGVDCVSSVTPHDRIAGNVSLAEALRQIAQRGDAAPDVARAALERLEG